ncbi:hypothetical protein B0H67DRAFT_630460 [Lasiosphaeris hirsuta]|uniref:Uncharacterized protein n=1 Tax=Lasiosphaeris hirsuta TaxID=260670 RepID=A0AA40B947_9PEZI|nr:hypothetical protein B0H67DRAFT_630460 [Lasiosphaeris hirsuta]
MVCSKDQALFSSIFRLHGPAERGVRQQRTLPRRQATISPRIGDRSSTPSSQRALRRTPHFVASPSPRPSEPQRRVHIEAATVGISPRPVFPTAGGPPQQGRQERTHQTPRRQLSQDLSDDLEEASSLLPSYLPQRYSSSASRSEPHPVVRVSRHTKSAILWTLEEALRQPNPFSPDPVEEDASMADLLAGGPATSNGNGATSTRPTAPPAQTGSPQQVIRGPRVIMRERAEREARQRAEREQIERIRAEEEARLLEETRRRAAERRASAAGTAQQGGGSEIPIAIDPTTQRRQIRAQEAQGTSRMAPSMPQATAPQQAAAPAPLRPTRVPTSAQAPQSFAAPQPGPAPAQPGESSNQGMGATRVKNSFPHAFERWEALSAHWEGMTGFWMRKLQENTDELDRNPISSQLSRQVGDLSAAGANLFHAVVELQRLRASSERKFQRWFFETRGELERNQEVNAMLEAQLEEERQRRTEAVREASYHERENQKLQKLHAEQRKELLISKDEARRAWEELGRREQEERDRTISLQQGLPTIVGGVQVVPMTQGVPSRQTSTRDQRSHSQAAADTSEYVAAQGSHYPDYSQPPPVQPGNASAGGPNPSYYQQQAETAGHETGSYGAGSEAGYSEGEYVIDAHGNFVRDSHGNRIPYRSPNSPARGVRGSDGGAEDFETPASQAPTSYPPSSSQWAGTQASGPEYSGQGYAAPGWETMPRHHHPTRLSDVIEEEDERSRTSASQVSRA